MLHFLEPGGGQIAKTLTKLDGLPGCAPRPYSLGAKYGARGYRNHLTSQTLTVLTPTAGEVHAWLYPEMSQTQAVHADSISSQDPNSQVEKKAKSRRPASEMAKPHVTSTCASIVELIK